MKEMNEKEYYVYAWYFKSTNEIFHIGKGKGNRYKERKIHRNEYFKSILNKYKDDVDVKKLFISLTNDEALALEKKLIKEYKEKGWCKTNFHEGGTGGNTGNYNSPERSKKLSEFAKTRTGNKNPNFNNHWSNEQKMNMSKKVKDAWKDPIIREKMLKNRDNSKYSHPAWNKGIHYKEKNPHIMTETQYLDLMKRECEYKYEVYFNGQLIYWCLGHTHLHNFCKETFNISREIVYKLVKNEWKPKFKKHMHLKELKIIPINRSVTTNSDECNCVEWRLQPFEVPSSHI